MMGISQEAHGELLWRRLLLFSGSVPSGLNGTNQRWSQKISFIREGHVHESGVPTVTEGSETEIVNPFSYLITLSKRSREATVFNVLVLSAPLTLEVFILSSKNHNAGPNPSLV